MNDLLSLLLAAACGCIAFIFFILAFAYPAFGVLSFFVGGGFVLLSFRVMP